jgi:serine/threonine-protein kinase CTR1
MEKIQTRGRYILKKSTLDLVPGECPTCQICHKKIISTEEQTKVNNEFVHEACERYQKKQEVYEQEIKKLKDQLESGGKKANYMDETYQLDRRDIILGKRLGAGACGEVFLGKLYGMDVAVKILFLSEDERQTIQEDFENEVSIMKRLHHPNIVLLMGAVTNSKDLMIVTEFAGNGSLCDLLHDKGEILEWDVTISISEQTALGMNWLHHHKPVILHRDLKTANILLDSNMVVKLADFGISKILSPLSKEEEGFFGSPLYSAPECLLGMNHTEKSDVYSFSYVIWEMITNKIPYAEDFTTFEELVDAVAKSNFRAPIPKNTPKSLVKLLKTCWDGDVKKRPSFQSILDSEIFKEILNELTVQPDQGDRNKKKKAK